MRARLTALLVSAALAVAAGLGAAASAAPAPAPPASSYAQDAYPQTKPKAGQFCKGVHRGVVTRASNGRKVRCTPDGSRHRWRYVR